MNRQHALMVIVISLLLGATATGLGDAQNESVFVRGEPDLQVFAPDPTLTPGSTTNLTLQVANDGEIRLGASADRGIVTTARAVTVELEGEDPIAVETERQSVGSVTEHDVKAVPITVTVPEDAPSGEYTCEVTLDYSHTYQYSSNAGAVQERSRTVTRSIELRVDDGPRFEMQTLDSDVRVGDAGTLRTNITNVGGETARDLTVELESTSEDLTLGETARNTARIDELDPGENATLTYEANVRSDAALRTVPITGTIRFTDPDGVRDTQDGISIGVQPGTEQGFVLSVDESTLRVNETGVLRGTVQNMGPANVSDAVLVLDNATFEPRNPTYSIGDLAANKSTTFQFRGTVPFDADAVPQRIDITTLYRTPADNERETHHSLHVPIAERRDAVVVTAIDSQFDAGEDGVLELSITNRRETEIRDVRLTVGVNDPLESDVRTTVVPSLQPGETDRVAFDLSIDSDAPETRFPATVGVTYTDHDDRRKTARPSTVAITVTETGDDLSTEIFIFGFLLIVVAAGAWWFYGRG
ncbi:COG1361 S-layer family protein [Halanaeroarchaeum sulfurireducens]|uniref:Alpha-galactosidase NEW3 domain-containing protein n=1 Tax=Halanaeroarchaeum sulfurireducens TaxID=1604004 RepID=A0A0F7PD35_9EURY|nr:COG1361 S-layer family protein [Halanaeroarchaeum sulfurireducens]AKH97554.1 hypothetical protein HLASF_1065 [Halanaeroarchaeum sulfurireducens]ALG81950.1 hypothetical protein HLASA_1054 [Halanaeroarchaeum sulfurireducens]